MSAHTRKVCNLMATTTTRKSNTRKPATAKLPEDHKPKATAETEAKQVEDFTIHLHGRDWTIEAAALDDFELLEKLSIMDAGGGRAAAVMPSVLRELLGDAQYAEAMDVLRNPETGRVPTAEAAEFVMGVIGGLNPNS